MVGASGWEQIQGPRCCLVEAEGGAGRAGFSGLIRVGTRRHTRQPSPQPLPGSGRMGGTRVLLVWGGRDTVGGPGRTDVLVCGPTCSPEKASGENTSVLLVQAMHRTCQGSGFDFEIT